eukprot:scaffold8267_cov74-Cyclotella_meneghiniana.AAC.7
MHNSAVKWWGPQAENFPTHDSKASLIGTSGFREGYCFLIRHTTVQCLFPQLYLSESKPYDFTLTNTNGNKLEIFHFYFFVLQQGVNSNLKTRRTLSCSLLTHAHFSLKLFAPHLSLGSPPTRLPSLKLSPGGNMVMTCSMLALRQPASISHDRCDAKGKCR